MGIKFFGLGFALALILALFFCLFICPKSVVRHKQVLRVDTLVQILPPKTIKIERTKTKIKYVRDTFILEKPFIASFDTISSGDTVSAKYFFPEHEISLSIHPAAETTKIPLLVPQTIEKKKEWWHSPAIFVSGFILGWLFTKK